MKHTTDDPPSDRLPSEEYPQARGFAQGILFAERVMKLIDAFVIWFLGDPYWRSKPRIDWRKSVLFRRPWTPSEEHAMRRAAEQEIHREFDDNEHK
jgi:hypothetical protein